MIINNKLYQQLKHIQREQNKVKTKETKMEKKIKIRIRKCKKRKQQ